MLGHARHSSSLKRTAIDPVSWGEQYFFHQAEVIQGGTRTLYASGQVGLEQDGETFAGTGMGDQLSKVLSNIDDILKKAHMDRSNIVHVRTYVTDMEGYIEHFDIFTTWITEAGIMPTHTLLGVAALFNPECVVEVEIEASA